MHASGEGLEDALDANNTIARATAPTSIARRAVVNLMAPRAPADGAAERVLPDLGGVRAGCWRRSEVAGRRPARVAARARDAAQNGQRIGGECHLDANMVRSGWRDRLGRPRLLVVENVGNSSARQSSGGEDARVMICSDDEGEDKP